MPAGVLHLKSAGRSAHDQKRTCLHHAAGEAGGPRHAPDQQRRVEPSRESARQPPKAACGHTRTVNRVSHHAAKISGRESFCPEKDHRNSNGRASRLIQGRLHTPSPCTRVRSLHRSASPHRPCVRCTQPDAAPSCRTAGASDAEFHVSCGTSTVMDNYPILSESEEADLDRNNACALHCSDGDNQSLGVGTFAPC